MSDVDSYPGAKTKLLICQQTDNYPGAQGKRGLWRQYKTPKSLTCAQLPTKQESPFVRMGSPCHSDRGWMSLGITSLVLALLIGLNINNGYTVAAQALDGQPSRSSSPASLLALSSEQLQPFKGQWHFHSSLLTVGNDGYATFITRAYQFCGQGILQPCDAWLGNIIIPGIQEKIVLTKIDGMMAYGIITSSTDNKTQQKVTLTLQPNDTLKFNDMLLCGPKGPIGHCGA
jgi:hypothetical protein